MLSLNQRDCFLGEKYQGKKRKHEDVRTLKIELTEVMLDKRELAALLGEPHAYEALYDTSGKPHRPFLVCIKALELKEHWKGAYVAIWYELGAKKLEFKRAELSKIKLELRLGGEIAMSCRIEGDPELTASVLEVISRTGTNVECEIRAERPEDQRELPLSTHGEGEQSEHSSRKPRGRASRPLNG